MAGAFNVLGFLNPEPWFLKSYYLSKLRKA